MNDKYLNDIMHAYAAGCLDHEDLIPIIDSLKSNGSLNNSELSELQNIISLLPAILMTETPPVSAKDNIAKRLYAIREEMIAKKNQEAETRQAAQPIADERFETTYRSKENQEPVDSTEPKPTYTFLPKESEREKEQRSERYVVEKPSYDEPQTLPKKENKSTLIALIAIFILLIAGASALVYVLMQQKIDAQEETIAAIRSDITVLNDEILRLNKIQRILAILGSKDVSTFNLDGTIDNPTGFGKIVFDPLNREGLLSLFNMPALSKDKTYQLWLMSKGQPFSLGLFNPQKNADRYITIDEFPDIPLNNIESFLLTVEDAGGSDVPKGAVYLSSMERRR